MKKSVIWVSNFFIVLTLGLNSFSAEISPEKHPSWFSELFQEGEWDKFHNSQEHPKFGHELDEEIAIIAEAYMASGAKGIFSIGGYKPPIISKFIYGDDYTFSGIEKSAKDKYDSFDGQNILFKNFLIVHAITKGFGEEPTEHCFYFMVNKQRRENLNAEVKLYFSYLQKALFSLPKSAQPLTLYRYIDLSNSTLIPQLNDTWDLSFASCSALETKNAHFSGNGIRPVKIILEDVDPSVFRSIHMFSQFPDEQEVMILEQSFFAMCSMKQLDDDGKTLLVMCFKLNK